LLSSCVVCLLADTIIMGNIVRPLWAECPAVARSVLVGYTTSSLVLTLLNAFIVPLPLRQLFACSLSTAWGDKYIWTLLLSPFYAPFGGGMSFLMLLFALYLGLQYFPMKERELGSLGFGLWLLLASCAQNLVFLVFMICLCAIETSTYYAAANQGLWPLLMVMMSTQMLHNPEGATSFWGIVQIPNKWYPLVLVGFFCLLNQGLMWNFIAGISVAYAAYLRPSLLIDRLLPSTVQLGRIEQCLCRQRQSWLGGAWLPASARGYTATQTQSRHAPAATTWGLPRSWTSCARSKFAVFSGAGNRLGESNDSAEALLSSREKHAAVGAAAPGITAAPGAAATGPTGVCAATTPGADPSEVLDRGSTEIASPGEV